MGPNGCGKSTLLRVIAGLLEPAVGNALLDGLPIDGPDPRIGLVFQEPRLLPVALGRGQHHLPARARRLAGAAPPGTRLRA